MQTIWAHRALVMNSWAEAVRIDLTEDGRIGAVITGADCPADAKRVQTLLPAPGNLHSHAFQRAWPGYPSDAVAIRKTAFGRGGN
jgi:formimidoylglutamate deiminase